MNSLKRMLEQRNISQVELAKLIGVADSAVSKWIKWEFKIPAKHRAKICEVLSCDPAELEFGPRHV